VKIVTARVTDASAIIAILFNEITRDAILPRLHGSSLHAPLILPFEVANACLKKMRAFPGERDLLLQAFASLAELPIELEKVDPTQALLLAEQTSLTVYDASYLWLARVLGADLVTLDRKLAQAHEKFRV
jgi:predicted nucleic acid-binding protein